MPSFLASDPMCLYPGLPGLCVPALALALLIPAPLAAQSLPDWAAPSAREAGPSHETGGVASLVPCPPGQTDDGMGGCTPDPPGQVPIDGGLGLLALAGAALAARRLHRAS